MVGPLGTEIVVDFKDGTKASYRIKPTVMNDETMDALLSLDRRSTRTGQLETIAHLKEALKGGSITQAEFDELRGEVVKQMTDPQPSIDPTDALKRFNRALGTKEGMIRALMMNCDEVNTRELAEKIYNDHGRWPLWVALIEAGREGEESVKNSDLPEESGEKKESPAVVASPSSVVSELTVSSPESTA